jgi:hypothetical protein
MNISGRYPMKVLHTQGLVNIHPTLEGYAQRALPSPRASTMPLSKIARRSLAGGGQEPPSGEHPSPSLLLHLRQCRLSLGQPERHVHSAV